MDVLLNNAGLIYKNPENTLDQIKKMVETNFICTSNLSEYTLNQNLISRGGIILSIGSFLAKLNVISDPEIKSQLINSKTKQDLLDLYQQSLALLSSNKPLFNKRELYPDYGFSKLLLQRYIHFLAQSKQVLDAGVQIYSCSVGWVKTDMGGDEAPLTVEEGVATPLYVLGLRDQVDMDIQGKYFFENKVGKYM